MKIPQKEKLQVPVHVPGSRSRKFYLTPPSPARPHYYIRFDVPRALRDANPALPATVFQSTGTDILSAAKEIAATKILDVFGGRWDTVQKQQVARPQFCTLGDIVDAYEPDPQEVDAPQKTRNKSAFLLVAREMMGKTDARKLSADVYGDGVAARIRAWQIERVGRADAANKIAVNSARRTINSTLAMAKSVLSPKVMHCYAGLKLPDFAAFRAIPRLSVRASDQKYVPWSAEVHAAIMRDAETRLRTEQPMVYRAFWLMYRLGLRNIEAASARRSWIRRFPDGSGEFDLTITADFDTKTGKSRSIKLTKAMMLQMAAIFTDLEPRDFLINLKTPTERARVCYRDINKWIRQFLPATERQKGAYELRKEAASIIADRPESEGGGIQAAADFLGDTIAVTEKHYRGVKRSTVAVTDAEAAPRVVIAFSTATAAVA